MPTTYNVTIHLNDQERFEEKARAAGEELDKIVPGVREELRAKKIPDLSQEERDLLEIPAEKRSVAETFRANAAEGKVKPTYYEVADRADPAHRVEALRLADAAASAANHAQIIDRYRDIVNFDYWRRRCDLEQTDDAWTVRKLVYDADAAFRNSDLEKAKLKYDEGFQKWAAVLEAFPQFKNESTFIGDLKDIVDRYRKLLEQLELKLPDDFILKDIIESQEPVAPSAGERIERRDRRSFPARCVQEKAGGRRRSARPGVSFGRLTPNPA